MFVQNYSVLTAYVTAKLSWRFSWKLIKEESSAGHAQPFLLVSFNSDCYEADAELLRTASLSHFGHIGIVFARSDDMNSGLTSSQGMLYVSTH
jgi:hypothetical protein